MSPLFLLLDSSSSVVSLWSLLAKGGVIMIPLGLLVLLGVYIFIERFLLIRSSLSNAKNFSQLISQQLASSNIESIVIFCKTNSHPLSRLLLKGIEKVKKSSDIIEKSMYATAKIELFKLERRVSILSVIGYVAPLFGFLGTIIGMFELFYNIASTGEYTIATIAGGIYVKMISSAAGLIIGLAAYIGYRVLEAMIDAIEHRMEEAITDFLDIIHGIRP